MSFDTNSGEPQSMGAFLRDLPKFIWAIVLFIGGIAYIAMQARRVQQRHPDGAETAVRKGLSSDSP